MQEGRIAPHLYILHEEQSKNKIIPGSTKQKRKMNKWEAAGEE